MRRTKKITMLVLLLIVLFVGYVILIQKPERVHAPSEFRGPTKPPNAQGPTSPPPGN